MSTPENIAGIDAHKTKKILITELEALRRQVAELDQSSRDRESQLLNLATNLPGIVYQRTLHPDGTTTFPIVSPGVREVYGYEAEELMAEPSIFQNVIFDEDRDSYRESLAASIQTMSEWKWEGRVAPKDGGLKWVEVSAQPRQSADGCIHWDGLILDITERKRVERALRESEARFRDFADNLPMLIAYIDDERRYSFVNKTFENWTLRSNDEVNGKYIWEVLGEKAYEGFRFQIDNVLSGEPTHFEIELTYPDGNPRYIESTYVPDFGDDGQVKGYFILAIDITERKRAEEALRASVKRFLDFADTSADWFWEMDADFKFTFVSPKVENTIGVPPEFYVGNTFEELLGEDYDPSIWDQFFSDLQQGNSIRDFEFPRQLSLAKPGWSRISAAPVRAADGTITGYRGCSSDITSQKTAEDQLRQAQKLEAVGQLTGGVAHDFNNLLTVIMSNLELLKMDQEDDGAQHELTEAALRATQRGAELTHRLLAFSRRQALRPEATDLNDLVGGMMGLLTRTLGETINIETALSGQLWNATVDPGQLEAALLNLAINAQAAMPGGGKLTIETANTTLDDEYAAQNEEVAPGPYVLLAVSDSGTGMPPEILAQVFEPFFTTKEVGTGSGLGLSMVYGFVKQSGGHVNIYSEVGHGTTVKIHLPRSLETGAVAEGATPVGREPRGEGETIMVVEDDADVRTSVVRLLASLGYRTIEAGDGEEALSLIDETPEVSLLFTDVVLPGGMNGNELARQARERRPGLKVLFTSGYTETAIVHHGRLDDGVELIEKPYLTADLARKVRAALER